MYRFTLFVLLLLFAPPSAVAGGNEPVRLNVLRKEIPLGAPSPGITEQLSCKKKYIDGVTVEGYPNAVLYDCDLKESGQMELAVVNGDTIVMVSAKEPEAPYILIERSDLANESRLGNPIAESKEGADCPIEVTTHRVDGYVIDRYRGRGCFDHPPHHSLSYRIRP